MFSCLWRSPHRLPVGAFIALALITTALVISSMPASGRTRLLAGVLPPEAAAQVSPHVEAAVDTVNGYRADFSDGMHEVATSAADLVRRATSRGPGAADTSPAPTVAAGPRRPLPAATPAHPTPSPATDRAAASRTPAAHATTGQSLRGKQTRSRNARHALVRARQELKRAVRTARQAATGKHAVSPPGRGQLSPQRIAGRVSASVPASVPAAGHRPAPATHRAAGGRHGAFTGPDRANQRQVRSGRGQAHRLARIATPVPLRAAGRGLGRVTHRGPGRGLGLGRGR